MLQLSLSGEVLQVLTRLREAGFEAFIVGGTVRDLLLRRVPHDIDVVTSAPPEATKRLFPHHFEAGAVFGVVGVPTDAGVIDVGTYRTESNYHDRRRPSTVAWASLRDDVVRRDFTINGLAYDPVDERIIDYVGGQRDLALGLVRTIGRPIERFHEDPLRMIRAVRIRNELVFQYDPNTYHAIRALAPELTHVATERVLSELDRMWRLPHRAEALSDLDDLRLLDVILPEVTALHGVPQPREFHREGDVFDHTVRAVRSLPPGAPPALVWATLLHDVAKPLVLTYQTEQIRTRTDSQRSYMIRTPDHARRSAELAAMIADRLRFSRDVRETVVWTIEHHMSLKDIERMRPASRERYVLDPRFPLLLELHRADALGADPSDLSLYEHDLRLYETLKAQHASAPTTPPPLITGHDLIELELPEGPQFQQILEAVRNAQLEGKIKSRDDALKLVGSLLHLG